MKDSISLFEAYQLARAMRYSEFEQEIKVILTGKTRTEVIDDEVVIKTINHENSEGIL